VLICGILESTSGAIDFLADRLTSLNRAASSRPTAIPQA
jgi:hypothetical protein